jgi:DNA anti-recombination protein RmuC
MKGFGGAMATTKATLVASRIKYIEAALAKLERELENSEGSHKEALQRWVAEVQQTLRRIERLTLH